MQYIPLFSHHLHQYRQESTEKISELDLQPANILSFLRSIRKKEKIEFITEPHMTDARAGI